MGSTGTESRMEGAHSSGAHEAGLAREEVQLGHRGVMRVPYDGVQLARLQVPHCDHTRAAACCHERDARACNEKASDFEPQQASWMHDTALLM